MIWCPFFIFFIFRELVIDRILFEKCLAVENTSWCNLLMWSRGGGKWFILYQSNKHYFIWAMIWCPFFHFSHISGAGNWSRTKELKLKMFWVWKMPHCWKCLVVEKVAAKSVSEWKTPCAPKCHCSEYILWCKIPRGGKCLVVQRSCNHCQKVKKTSPRLQHIQLLPFITCLKET